MFSLKLLIYLSIGTCAMLLPILIQSHWYKVKLWKRFVLAILIAVTGMIGTYILFFVENHRIGGTSFYGGVFLVPIAFLFIEKLLRMKYSEIMDLCAPAGCIMLVIMKIQCLLSGCCRGKILFESFRFPSQIAELVNSVVIMIILMVLAYKKPKRGDIYPLYMVIYGVTRFGLNLLREANTPFFIGLPAGNVWSLVSIIVGTAWLIAFYKKQKVILQ